jgi:hypothetical protein
MNGQYLQYIARVDALLVDSVEDCIASALNNALSSLHQVSQQLQLGRWALF